jgi:hypothetical protein
MDLISDTLSTIKSFNLAKNADINNTIINYPYYDPANLRLDSLEKSCDIDFVLEQEIVPNQDSRPKPPNSEFGIPTIMQLVGVKWLTQTESRDLVLLVGVIGFGLFGTLVKPFVRGERSRSRRNYIGGMSAAIIVYLLSIGGLAIFTQGELLLNLMQYMSRAWLPPCIARKYGGGSETDRADSSIPASPHQARGAK